MNVKEIGLELIQQFRSQPTNKGMMNKEKCTKM